MRTLRTWLLLAAVLLLVVVALAPVAPVATVAAQGDETGQECMIWTVHGKAKELLASDIILAAVTIDYVERFTLTYNRLFYPPDQFDIFLYIYCTGPTDFDRIFGDLMFALRTLYPERWGTPVP